MPSKSKAQQRLMGVAYAVKKGDMQLSDVDASYKDEVKDLVDNMSLDSLKKYAATKHDGLPERVPENIQVGQINGMGPVELPADGLLGSGDVPAGSGDAEEEYKKKKKKMANFEEFINGINQSKVDETYGGTASDFKYEFTNQFEEVTGFSDKAIKGIKKKGKNSYEVRTSTYAGKEYMEAVGKEMGLELKGFERHSNMCISVYESAVNEWGSSDSYAMSVEIHHYIKKPKKMPSPFDKRLRDAAESAVDRHWEEWEEYKTNYDSLVDDAVRTYLRHFHRDEYMNMVKMFAPVEESTVAEAKARKYDNVDIQTAWVDAFGKKYDIFDEFPDVIDDVMNDYRDKATIQDLYDIWDDRYGQEPPQEFLDVLQESNLHEAKRYTVKDVLSAWEDAFGEDMRDTDRADIPDDIESDYRGKVTVKDLQEIYDDRYGEELEPEFLEALGESVVNEIRMSAWGDLVYTEDQVNTEHGWCGTLAHELGDDKAMFLTHQSIHELQKSHMGLTAWEALAVLNSKAGRHAAEAYLGGDSAASDATSALIWYYGSKAKVKKHAKEERELQFPSKK
jgi:hypothetical protein